MLGEIRAIGRQFFPCAPQAAVQLSVADEFHPLRRGPREPIEEFLRQIARLNRLHELLGDVGFGEHHFDFHEVTL